MSLALARDACETSMYYNQDHSRVFSMNGNLGITNEASE